MSFLLNSFLILTDYFSDQLATLLSPSTACALFKKERQKPPECVYIEKVVTVVKQCIVHITLLIILRVISAITIKS